MYIIYICYCYSMFYLLQGYIDMYIVACIPGQIEHVFPACKVNLNLQAPSPVHHPKHYSNNRYTGFLTWTTVSPPFKDRGSLNYPYWRHQNNTNGKFEGPISLPTVDGSEILHQLIDSLSQYLPCFFHMVSRISEPSTVVH